MVAICPNERYNVVNLSFIWWFGFLIGFQALGVGAPGAFLSIYNYKAKHVNADNQTAIASSLDHNFIAVFARLFYKCPLINFLTLLLSQRITPVVFARFIAAGVK